MPGVAPTSGDEYLLYINTSATAPTLSDQSTFQWTLISGQRTFNPKYSTGTADTTDKDSANNEEHLPTNRSMEATVEGVREEDDPGQEALKAANKTRTMTYFKYSTPEGNEFFFLGSVTQYGESAPQADAVTYSATIKRSGAETEL